MKRLLIVAQHFAPSSVVAAQRPLKLVRRMREFGWEPFVLTMPPGCQQAIDWEVGRDIPEDIVVKTVPCRSLWRHSVDWHRAQPGLARVWSVAKKVLAKYSYPLVPVDEGYPWVLAARRAGVRLVRRNKIDLIWATSPPFSSLCLARDIHLRTGVPYVADFRDVKRLCDKNLMPRRERRNARIESVLMRDAAGITYISPPQLEILRKKHLFVDEVPSCLAYNWFEAGEAELEATQTYDRLTILHGGALYGGARRLGGFLEALSILTNRGEGEAKRIQFVQHVTESKVDDLRAGIDQHALHDAVQIRPSLSRPEFLSACRSADILLLVVGHNVGPMEHAGTIPAKLFDYFLACRPVLVIGPPDCEAGKVIVRTNRGLAVPDEVPDQIAEAINRLLSGQGNNGPLDLSLDSISEFEASTAVQHLSRFFDSLFEA